MHQKLDLASLSCNPKKYPREFLTKCFGIYRISKKNLRDHIFKLGYGYPSKYDKPEDEIKKNDVIFNKKGMQIVKETAIQWNNFIDSIDKEQKINTNKVFLAFGYSLFNINPKIDSITFESEFKKFIKSSSLISAFEQSSYNIQELYDALITNHKEVVSIAK